MDGCIIQIVVITINKQPWKLAYKLGIEKNKYNKKIVKKNPGLMEENINLR